MSARTLPYTLEYAFKAGEAARESKLSMARARKATEPYMRSLNAQIARDWNHIAIENMRYARYWYAENTKEAV